VSIARSELRSSARRISAGTAAVQFPPGGFGWSPVGFGMKVPPGFSGAPMAAFGGRGATSGDGIRM